MHDGNCIECIAPPITLCIFSRIRSFSVSPGRGYAWCSNSCVLFLLQFRAGTLMEEQKMYRIVWLWVQREYETKAGFQLWKQSSLEEFLDSVYAWLHAYTDGFFFLVVLVVVVKFWASYLVCLRNSQTIHVTGSRFFEKMVIIYSWTWAITLNETGTTCA